MTRPRCAGCNKPLAKKTESVTFWINNNDAPRNKAECQARTNHQVVSLRYGVGGQVMSFSTWDGESYEGPFCSGTCAQVFARWALNQGVRRFK